MKKWLTRIAVAAVLVAQLATPVLACIYNTPLTQGYWKNHVSEWPTVCQGATFNGIPWEQILNHNCKDGDAWYILAHQWIAYWLNCSNYALNWDCELYPRAQALLSGGPGSITDPAERAEAIELATKLEGLNNVED